MKLIALFAMLGCFASPAFGVDDDPAERPVPVSGKPSKGALMDYGPFLSSSLTTPNPKGELIASRSITVRLSKDAFVAYDTETMRVAAAWTGGWLDIAKTHLTTPKGSIPAAIGGKVLFTTPVGPGWSKGGSLDDPRTDLRTGKFGPLPREWAHYKGLYVHGERVVLSYTVGTANVLELPGVATDGDLTVFTRTIHIDKSEEPLEILVADGDSVTSEPFLLRDFPAGLTGHEKGKTQLVTVPRVTKPLTFTIVMRRTLQRDVDSEHQKIRKAYLKIGEDETELSKFVSGGAASSKPIETVGVLAKPPAKDAFPYVVDTLTLPFENPQNAWMRLTALDFFEDGKSAAVSTWNGDVWVVSGIDEKLEKLTWRRFASGLYEPLGLKILKGKIYVLGRDQITRLHDLNGDGQADFYENFNNDGVCYPQYHHFKMDLDADRAGNLYCTAGGNWAPSESFGTYNSIIRVSADGSRSTNVARGLRAANGMAVGPRGEIVSGDNQGHWTPASKINYIPPNKTDGFYGYPFDPRMEKKLDLAHFYPNGVPTSFEPPLCWVPYSADTSSGGQAFVPAGDDRWGPFEGHIIHTSYGKSALFMTMHELVDAGGKLVPQGGVWKFPLTFEAGIMRPRFNPGDGQLYVAGLRGWQNNAAKDGCLQRVRYTGGKVRLPERIRATKQGIYLTFTSRMDAAAAADLGSYDVEQWNYKWTAAYGSPDFSVTNPTKKGHDTVEIKSAKLAEDGYTVFLEMPTIQPVMQMSITYKLKSADGQNVEGVVYNTINVLK